MPLDNRISNIIATPLPEHIKSQLKYRSQKHAQPSRGDSDLIYLANKSAWIRLVSSVDLKIGSENFSGDMKYFAQVAGQPSLKDEQDLAKLFILFGGTSKYEKNPFNGNFNYKTRYGLGLDGAYGMLGDEEIRKYGYRPMPGITEASVETQGRMGSIRKAKIQFKVWDKDQLDIIDALYFKLGYTMFLEWGHVLFYHSEKKQIQYGEDYLIDPFEPGLTKESILLKINDNARKSQGNYDGMMGIVTNFNFSFNQDGGYDCSLDLISLGILGESMKINHPEGLPKLLEREIQYLADVQRKIQEQKDAEAAAAQEKKAQEDLNNQLKGKLSIQEVIRANAANRGVITPDKKNLPIDSVIVEYAKQWGLPNSNVKSNDYKNYDLVLDANVFGRNSAISYYLPKFGVLLPNEFDKNEFSNFVLDSSKINQILAEDYTLHNNSNSIFDFFTNSLINDRITYIQGTAGGFRGIEETILKLGFGWTTYFGVDIKSLGVTGISYTYKVNYVSKSNGNTYSLRIELHSPSTSNISVKDFAFIVNDFLRKLDTEDQSAKLVRVNTAQDELADLFSDLSGNNLGQFFSRQVNKLNNSVVNPITTFLGVYSTDVDTLSDNPRSDLQTAISGTTHPASAKKRTYFEFYITTNDTSLIKDVTVNKDYQTADYIKYKANLQNQAEQSANDKKNAQEKSKAELETKNKQIAESLQYQSSLEIALRSIQLHSLAVAENNSNKGQVEAVLPISLYGDGSLASFKDSFAANLFSYGIFSDFINELMFPDSKSSNNFYIDPTGEGSIVTIDSKSRKPLDKVQRLKYGMKYGFNTNFMNGSLTSEDIKGKEVNYKDMLTTYVVPYQINQSTPDGSAINYPVYVRFDTVLMLLNHMCMLYDSSEPVSSTDGSLQPNFKTPLVYIDFNTSTTTCLSSPRHLSTDPMKFLIPFQGRSSDYYSLFDEKILASTSSSNAQQGSVYINPPSGSVDPILLFDTEHLDFLSKQLPQFKIPITNDSAQSYRGRPLNVLINIDYLMTLVQQYAKSDGTNEVFLKSFIEQILNDMNKSLGNFNGLTLVYNDYSNVYHIIDAQLNAPEGRDRILSTDASEEIPLYGLGSIAKSFEIHTEISSKLSNMIAISSNSHPNEQSQNSLDATSFGFINQSFTDRYIPRKESISAGKPATDTEKIAASRFNDCIKDFYSTAQPSEANISMATNYYIARMNAIKGKESPTRASSMIPVSVTFTIDGIGGIPMFSGFTVDRHLLPYTYNDRPVVVKQDGKADSREHNMGFVIVGKTDSISEGAWNTAIKGSMVYLKKSEDFNGSSINTNLAQGLLVSNANTSPNLSPIGVTVPTGPARQNLVRAVNALNTSTGIKALMLAQIQLEGYNPPPPAPGSKSYRTNNPGNVGNFGNGTLRYYSNLQDGVNAMLKVVTAAINKQGSYKNANTLYDYISIYAPYSDGNNPPQYTSFVMGYFKKVGIELSDPVRLSDIAAYNKPVNLV